MKTGHKVECPALPWWEIEDMLYTTFNMALNESAKNRESSQVCKASYSKMSRFLGGANKYGRDKLIGLDVVLSGCGYETALWCLRCTTEPCLMLSALLAGAYGIRGVESGLARLNDAPEIKAILLLLKVGGVGYDINTYGQYMGVAAAMADTLAAEGQIVASYLVGALVWSIRSYLDDSGKLGACAYAASDLVCRAHYHYYAQVKGSLAGMAAYDLEKSLHIGMLFNAINVYPGDGVLMEVSHGKENEKEKTG